MNKNSKILIILLVIITFILLSVFIIVKINNSKKEEKERLNMMISTAEQDDSNYIKQRLEQAGVKVNVKENIYSELLDEEGKIYELDGMEIEVYNVNTSKINTLVGDKQGEVTIEGKNGKKEEALVFENIIILKCIYRNMQDKLEEVLSTEKNKDENIIPITEE